MKKILGAALALVLLRPAQAQQVLTGLDVLESHGFSELKGLRVGLITNDAARDASGKTSAEVLRAAPGVVLAALFSPEHGLSGRLPDGETIHSTQTAQGLPIYSLYGKTLRPTPRMLSGLDVLVFDMQDVGTRFYTYLTTMAYAMEEASRHRIAFVVLDRPNPTGGSAVEGPVLDPSIQSFTAYLPIPVRHGLTPGEAALFFAASRGLALKLSVVPLAGWRREMTFDLTGRTWTPSSPNIPDVDSAILYSGLGCFEAANLDVGRDSETPFRWFGAPWLDAAGAKAALDRAGLKGLRFHLEGRVPAHGRYAGAHCRGVAIEVTDRGAVRPLDLFVHLICFLRGRHPRAFKPGWGGMAEVVGTREFQRLYDSGAGPEKILKMFRASARKFDMDRQPYLLYH